MSKFAPIDREIREQQLSDALELVARQLDGDSLTPREQIVLRRWGSDVEFKDLCALLRSARRELKDRSVTPDLATLRRMEETVLTTARAAREPAAELLAASPLPAGTDSELAQSMYPNTQAYPSDRAPHRQAAAVDTPSGQLRSDRALVTAQIDNHRDEPYTVELTLFEAVLGRSDVSLRIDSDAQVSRRHARLLLLDGNVVISDLDSRNGTHVNSRRIDEPEQVDPDDTVVIGGTSLILDHVESNEMGSLRATFSSQHGDRYVVDLSEVILGRASSSTVVLDDPSRRLSRRHARLDLCDGEVLITDLGSTNGVIRDGTLISGSALLEPDMTVELGGIEMRIVDISRS